MKLHQLIRAHFEVLENEGEDATWGARDPMIARLHRIAPTDVEYEDDTQIIHERIKERLQ
jgi:hypothetical protein